MGTTIQNRHQRGTKQGGRFAASQRGEQATANLATNSGERPCDMCGAMTKRTSGKCRKCDPARKKTGPSIDRGRSRTPSDAYDTSGGSIPVEEIGQCGFEFVPQMVHGHLKVSDDGATSTRPCKNAVRLPAERCHRHGGDVSTSLGRTVAKATAEAGRGECYPFSADHWEKADERIAAAQGQLLKIMATDTTSLAAIASQCRRFQGTHGAGRFSPTNQMLMVHQYAQGIDGDLDQEAIAAAFAMASEPHHTAAGWAELGRTINPGAQGVSVIWATPGHVVENSDEDGDDNSESDGGPSGDRRTTSYRPGRVGGHIQYRLSETDGEPFDVPPADYIDAFVPKCHGDPEAATDALVRFGQAHGFKIELTDHKPSSGAYGYWNSSESKIVVWTGIANENKAAAFHVLAHELGHAWLAHSTNDGVEIQTSDKEVAAEAFAALVGHEFGVDSAQLSATYIAAHRRAGGINMESSGLAPVASAAKAFDDFMTQFEAEESSLS